MDTAGKTHSSDTSGFEFEITYNQIKEIGEQRAQGEIELSDQGDYGDEDF